jgi:glycosyltransferase involved in cell wall biosynthesis
MLTILVNCGPAENYIADCLASILSQSVQEWQAFVTIDPAGDSTVQRAVAACGRDPRIHVHRNLQWQGPMVNTLEAIRRSNTQTEDVIVILDGDDKFATPHALRIIGDAYRDFDCWLTYGSWLSDLSDGHGMWPPYPDGLTDFRGHRWLGTGVRTWKRWLWDLIDDSDFRDASGQYFAVGEDQVILLPMLEMSGARARHVPEALMIYTRSSPHRVCFTRDAESRSNSAYIVSLPPYERLMEKPASPEDVQTLISARKRLRQALERCASY